MVDRYIPEVIPDFDAVGGSSRLGAPVYGDVRTTSDLYEDAFGVPVYHGTVNRLDIPSGYDYNTGRHAFKEDGVFQENLDNTDRLTDLDGKFQITAAANEEHTFKSREIMRYVPNYEILWGVAAWAETDLTTGQHFAIEFTDSAPSNGYRFHFEGTADGLDLTLEQFQGGSIVDSVDAIVGGTFQKQDRPKFDHTEPIVYRGFTNWYGVGETRYTASYPVRGADGEISTQRNPELGRTANTGDIGADRVNNPVGIRVWADAGADEFTVNVGSIGALIRGNAAEVDRQKPAIFWQVGNSNISQYPTDNVRESIAARIDPNRTQTDVSIEPPIFQPAGTGVRMEMNVYAIHQNNTDLTVNFDDPDDDGVDEGPSPAAQARGQTDVMQYTRNVTSIPTLTDIRADGTTGATPNMRHLTTTIGQSGTQSNPGTSTGGEVNIKRLVFPDDVIIFLPRTDPGGTTTSGQIRYLKTIFDQDW